MTPALFLEECQRRGVMLSLIMADGGDYRIRVSGPAQPPSFFPYLRQNKAALVALLSGSDALRVREVVDVAPPVASLPQAEAQQALPDDSAEFPYMDPAGFLRLAPDHCITPAGRHLYQWRCDERWHYMPDQVDRAEEASL